MEIAIKLIIIGLTVKKKWTGVSNWGPLWNVLFGSFHSVVAHNDRSLPLQQQGSSTTILNPSDVLYMNMNMNIEEHFVLCSYIEVDIYSSQSISRELEGTSVLIIISYFG